MTKWSKLTNASGAIFDSEKYIIHSLEEFFDLLLKVPESPKKFLIRGHGRKQSVQGYMFNERRSGDVYEDLHCLGCD